MSLFDVIPYMPHVQALLNAVAATLLFAGYRYIKSNNREAHKKCMVSALIVSTIFLASYLTYHEAVGYQPFEGQGWIRPIYFTFLFSQSKGNPVIICAFPESGLTAKIKQ